HVRIHKRVPRDDVAPATWWIAGATLQGRLEGAAAVVAVESAALADLSSRAGAAPAEPCGERPEGPARFVGWSALAAVACDAAEMTLDGGCALGLAQERGCLSPPDGVWAPLLHVAP
ncbi:MAG: hypothetical protein AABZ30_04220, partial [Myxococcota bacterium]